LDYLAFHKPITFFVGENVSGKSTMLEAIAVTYGFNPEVEILSFDNGEIYPCEYEETDSYQVTEMFINNREQILRRLLEG
jgi:predicted ATPase